jgi:hypothetical protein
MKLYIYTTTYFYQGNMFPKVTKTHLHINQKKLNKKFSEVYTSYGSPWFSMTPMWFHMHNKLVKIFHMTFHMNYHVKVKHIDTMTIS